MHPHPISHNFRRVPLVIPTLMEYLAEPVSPTGQCFDNSVLCIYVFVVFEFEVSIHDLPLASLVQDTLLSIPRFTSIMVNDKEGVKRWEKVEVKLENHIIEPSLSSDEFNDYLSKMAMEKLPHSKPLWEVHVIKNPTSTIIFKVHHSLGDGYSLMGVLLSCLRRADDPSLPLSFPSLKSSSKTAFSNKSYLRRFPTFLSSFFYSISDFGWSLLKAALVEDDKSPIRSGDEGTEFRPATILNMTFPMDHIKEIKSKLGVTVNDVITGIIFYGIRLYMQDIDYKSRTKHSTLMVMLNIRNVSGYQAAKDMQKTRRNQITYLHISMPKLKDTQSSNPLVFVWKAHNAIKRKKRSFATFLIGELLRMKHKFIGPEAVAKDIHRTVRNSSLLMSNMVGPLDQMALGNHAVKGFYFTMTGLPQSLVITIMSYMGMLRVTTRTEEGFIDEKKLGSYVNSAFEMIHKAAMEIPNKTK